MSQEILNENQLLLEVLDSVGDVLIGSGPVLEKKWTASRQYYVGYYPSSSSTTEYFLIRFENRWHAHDVRIGRNAQSVTIHPVDPDNGLRGRIHTTLKTIKKPTSFISMVIKAVDRHYGDNKPEGLMIFLEPKFAKYSRLILRAFKRSSLKSVMSVDSADLSADNSNGGAIVFAHVKTKPQSVVFKNVFSKFSKLDVSMTFQGLSTNADFVTSVVDHKKKEKQLSKKLTLDLSTLFFPGVETEENRELRRLQPIVTRTAPLEMRRKWLKYDSNASGFGSKNELAANFSHEVSRMFVETEELHTPIDFGERDSVQALKFFTGNGYNAARRVMKGQETGAAAEEGVKVLEGLDMTFKKHGHNLDGYRGFIYRGMGLDARYGNEHGVTLKRIFSDSITALPSYTSFSTELRVAAQFGKFDQRDMDNVVMNGATEIDGNKVFQTTSGSEMMEHMVKTSKSKFIPENPWDEYNNPNAPFWIEQASLFIYTRQDFKKIKVVMPGNLSSHRTEQEIIVSRGTLMTPINFHAYQKSDKDGWDIGIEYVVIDGSGELNIKEENNELERAKFLSDFLSESSRSKGKRLKDDKSYSDYYDSLSKEEKADRDLKFGGNIF